MTMKASQLRISRNRVYILLATVLYAHHISAKNLTSPELAEFSIEGLMQVSIASKTEHALRDVPSTVYIYTAEDIKRHGWLYLSDVLRHVPSVDMEDASSGAFFTTRGIADASAHGNKTIVMINGHNIGFPTTNSVNFLGLQKDFNLASVKQIEIQVGPGSTLYGANAFGMVVDLITYDPEDIDGIVANVAYGSQQQGITSFTASAGQGKWSALFSGRYIGQQESELAEIQISSTSGIENYDNDRFEDNFQSNYALDGYIDYDRQVRLGFNIMHNDSGHGTLFLSTDVGRRVFDKQLFYLDIKRQLTSRLEYRLKSHYLQTDSDAAKIKQEFTGSSNSRGSSDVGAKNIVLDNQFVASVGKTHTLLTGLFLERSRQRPLSGSFVSGVDSPLPVPTARPEQNWDNYAVYGQWEWQPNPKVYTLLGLRYVNSVKQYDAEYLPQVGLNFELTPSTNLKFSYRRGYRPPSLFEVGSTAAFLRPNPNLKSEFIDAYEFSVVQELFKKIQARGTLYYYDATNLIKRIDTGDFIPGTENPIFMDTNAGKLHVRGVEFGLKANIFDSLHISAMAMVTDSHDSHTDYDTETVVPYKGNVSIDWQMSSSYSLVVDNYLRIHPTTSRANTVFEGKDAPNWLLVNMNLRAQEWFAIKNLSANFTIFNVLNEEYGTIERRGGSSNIPAIHPADLRSFVFSLEYKLL